jgi:hypothetical protein
MRDVDPDEVWQTIGEIDPYFGVCSNERFRKDRCSRLAASGPATIA